MMELPIEVKIAKEYFENNLSHKLCPVADKLIVNPPDDLKIDLINMWRELIKKPPNHLLKDKVLTLTHKAKHFIEAQKAQARLLHPENFADPIIHESIYDLLVDTNRFMNLRRFQKKHKADRKLLALKINQLAKKLITLIELNEIEVIFHGCTNDGGLIYVDSSAANGINATNLITSIATNASDQLVNEPVNAKAGKNEIAIRFARRFLAHNLLCYGQPFNNRVAIITNVIYGTSYDKVNIVQLNNRVEGGW